MGRSNNGTRALVMRRTVFEEHESVTFAENVSRHAREGVVGIVQLAFASTARHPERYLVELRGDFDDDGDAIVYATLAQLRPAAQVAS